MILFGERSLYKAAKEFISHYHTERNYQGLDNRLIIPTSPNADLISKSPFFSGIGRFRGAGQACLQENDIWQR